MKHKCLFPFFPSMNKFPFSVLLFVLFPVIFGCSDKPVGFPALHPCRVEVLNNKKPEENVNIFLFPVASSGASSSPTISGKTDRRGIAVVATALHNYRQSGAPVGEYIVVLVKLPELADTVSSKERDRMLPLQQMAYNEEQIRRRAALPKIVPSKLTASHTSPLKMTVAEKTGASLTVDLADFEESN